MKHLCRKALNMTVGEKKQKTVATQRKTINWKQGSLKLEVHNALFGGLSV